MVFVSPARGSALVVMTAVMVLLVRLVRLATREPVVVHVWLAITTMQVHAFSARVSVFSAVSVPLLLLVCFALRAIRVLPATLALLATLIAVISVLLARILCPNVNLAPAQLLA